MKKLVEKRPDIVFFLKLFAIVSPDPAKVRSVICSKSLSVLEEAYEHKTVPDRDCPSKELDDNMAFASANGITAAPALIFPDGTIQLGYSDAAELERSIDRASGRQQKEGGQGPVE
jgi:thiol:disulfide interchange protein DsbC